MAWSDAAREASALARQASAKRKESYKIDPGSTPHALGHWTPTGPNTGQAGPGLGGYPYPASAANRASLAKAIQAVRHGEPTGDPAYAAREAARSTQLRNEGKALHRDAAQASVDHTALHHGSKSEIDIVRTRRGDGTIFYK